MSSAGYVIAMDPHEMSLRFTDKAKLLDDLGPEDFEESEDNRQFAESDYADRIAPLLSRLPPKEADLIELYYVQHKRQADIAEIYSVTQAAISYRLDRATQRLRYLISMPQVSEQDMRRDLAKFFEPIDVNILTLMWTITCQSEVAKTIGLTQGRVRHRFFKAVARLKTLTPNNPVLEPYCKVFTTMADGKLFNILKSVTLPQWETRWHKTKESIKIDGEWRLPIQGADCCVLDEEDAGWAGAAEWTLEEGRAVRMEGKTKIHLDREIAVKAGLTKVRSKVITHLNDRLLDCRRSNLRLKLRP